MSEECSRGDVRQASQPTLRGIDPKHSPLDSLVTAPLEVPKSKGNQNQEKYCWRIINRSL